MKKQYISTNKKRMLKVDWDAIFKKTSHEFTQDEIDAARGWETCPAGSVSEFIERDNASALKDDTLQCLGRTILTLVRNQEFDAAKDIYTLIQHREGQLLTQILKANKARIDEMEAEATKLIQNNTEIENLLK